LNGTVVIPDALAGGNHVAAGQGNRDEVLQLTGNDRRVYLVEAPHAFRNCAGGDERQSLDRHAKHLEIDVVHLPCNANPFGGKPMRPVGIAVLHEAQRPFPHIEPRLLGTLGKARQKTSGALKPPVGDRVLAAERPGVPGEPDCDSGGRLPIAALAVQTVRAFARVEDGIGMSSHHAASASPSSASGVSRARAATPRTAPRASDHAPRARY
jgi:hypothetical protein